MNRLAIRVSTSETKSPYRYVRLRHRTLPATTRVQDSVWYVITRGRRVSLKPKE